MTQRTSICQRWVWSLPFLAVSTFIGIGVIGIGALTCSPATAEPPASVLPSPVNDIAWKDLSGKSYAVSTLHASATVFFFINTQCPISNLYVPRMSAMAQTYKARGVQFFAIDSSSADSLSVLHAYVRDRGIPFPAVKDQGTALADRLAADSTPEAIVLDSEHRVRYRGHIDDNRDPAKVIRHDLADAIDALLAGRAVPRPRTLAFGCQIFRQIASQAPVTGPRVTFAHDIAPIFYANCTGCHRPVESGPFPLQTYADARAWAPVIKDYTTRHIMPPWKATPGYGDFRDARYLTDQQIQIIARWADQGAPQGDAKATPPLPHFASTRGWRLGTPDLVLKSTVAYHVPADTRDIYREFVLPAEFNEDRYFRGIELHPDNHAVVHHVILYLDPKRKSEGLDGKDGQPGYTVDGAGIFPPNSGAPSIFAAGWAAGNTPALLPKGTAVRIPAHAKLVLQVHYHPDGKEEVDNSSVGFYFADPAQVDKVITVGEVSKYDFDLKPGLAQQEFHNSFKAPVDMHLWSVSPHMHMLGRQMKMTETLPDGAVIPLVWVKDWDFNWQESYWFKEPVAVPKGARIDMMAVFDNSENNPRQTAHPPREVRFGEQTTDEMCIGFFTFTLDSQHLAAELGNKQAAAGPPIIRRRL